MLYVFKFNKLRWLLLFACTSASAEVATTQNLTLSEPCIGCQSTFSVSQATGPAGTGQGVATKTYSGLLEWKLGSTVSGRLQPFANVTRYGLSFDNAQLIQSFLSPRFWTVVIPTNAATCPTSETEYNFINVRFRAPTALRGAMQANSANFVSGGRLSYADEEEALIGTEAFSLASPNLRTVQAWYEGLGGEGPNGNTGSIAQPCDSGRHTMRSYGADAPIEDFNTIFHGDGGFISVGLSGNPVIAIASPVENLDATRMSRVADTVFTGFLDAYTGTPNRSDTIQKNIYIYPNANATSFSLRQFEEVDDPWNFVNYGSLDCPSNLRNSPMQGFMRCTLTLENVAGSGAAVCTVTSRGAREVFACNAQYPSDNRVPVSILAATHDRAMIAIVAPEPLNLSSQASGPVMMTATLKNMTNRNITNLGLPDINERLTYPFSINTAVVGNEPAVLFDGSDGECTNKLGPYGSCTIKFEFNPVSYGTFLATLRVRYDSGETIQNATATIAASSGLTSISITPPGPFLVTQFQQLTVTATYADESTQNITPAVAWTSANNLVVTVDETGLAHFLAASPGDTGITATFAEINTSISPTITIPPSGSADPSVGSGTGFQVVDGPSQSEKIVDVLLAPDGSSTILYNAINYGNGTPAITRLRANGTLDSGFGTNGFRDNLTGFADGRMLARQPDGKILILASGANSWDAQHPCYYTTVSYCWAIRRISATSGQDDTSFGQNGVVITGLTGWTHSNPYFPGPRPHYILVLDSGKILIVGEALDESNVLHIVSARYEANGTLDSTYGTNGIADAVMPNGFAQFSRTSISALADGKFMLLLQTSQGSPILARFNADGSRDTGFSFLTLAGDFSNWQLTKDARRFVVQPDGKYLIAGTIQTRTFSSYPENDWRYGSRLFLMRILADGSAHDPAFNSGQPLFFDDYDNSWNDLGCTAENDPEGCNPDAHKATSRLVDLALMSNGKIVAQTEAGLVRVNASGSLDASFGENGYSANPSSLFQWDGYGMSAARTLWIDSSDRYHLYGVTQLWTGAQLKYLRRLP
jgi:uncharacterized delta-60 repeat protein